MSADAASQNDAVTLIRGAGTVDAMTVTAARIRELVDEWLADGRPAESVTRAITTFNDLIAQRLGEIEGLAPALDESGGCWVALGSQGRCEQTLATDQDNGIIFADGYGAEAGRRRLLPLAQRVNDALDGCGFPLCRGGIMAANPQWCLTLSEWRERFARWIDEPDAQALLNAVIFFDFRRVYGEADATSTLRAWLDDYAPDRGAFLLSLARNALSNAPPLGLVRDFAPVSRGEYAGTLDLKVNGVQLFVESARVYALSRGIAATNTLDRFTALVEAGALRADEVTDYADAFRFIQGLRLQLNAVQRRRGEPLHNHLDPAALDDADRRILKGSLRQARRLQSRLARDFSLTGTVFGA
jgi:CBS domain-containing protein